MGGDGAAEAAGSGLAILFQTHRFGWREARAFAHLRRGAPPAAEVRVLFNLNHGVSAPPRLADVPHDAIPRAEWLTPRYPAKARPGPHGLDLARDGATDLVLLAFWRRNRGRFRAIWVVEYDVRFSGDWSVFFAAFEHSRAGLVAAALRGREDDPAWAHWRSWRPADHAPSGVADTMAAFMPVFRTTDALLEAVDAAYAAGATGHVERVWPSLAMAAGLGVEDLGGFGPFVAPANRGRFYTATVGDPNLTPGSFCYRPVRLVPGLRRNTLWHPVKRPRDKLADLWNRLRGPRRHAQQADGASSL